MGNSQESETPEPLTECGEVPDDLPISTHRTSNDPKLFEYLKIKTNTNKKADQPAKKKFEARPTVFGPKIRIPLRSPTSLREKKMNQFLKVSVDSNDDPFQAAIRSSGIIFEEVLELDEKQVSFVSIDDRDKEQDDEEISIYDGKSILKNSFPSRCRSKKSSRNTNPSKQSKVSFSEYVEVYSFSKESSEQ